MRRFLLAAVTMCALVVTPLAPSQAATSNGPTAVGYGGAVSSVDPTATAIGLDVLRHGGNAVDAAVAVAAALGVTEPFSAGVGGGGFFVYYDAKSGKVSTIDGREAAPASMTATSFIDPATGLEYPFAEARVSGLSVGVPGTLATWDEALRRWGKRSLSRSLQPAIDVARQGFVVDPTFQGQINANAGIFSRFGSTSELYLPGGQAPAVGSTFRNPDLADTYALVAEDGLDAFYGGDLAADLVDAVKNPPLTDPSASWKPGGMTVADLAAYGVRTPEPTHMRYRGYDVYGMATPSSGGSTVGEALNILETFDLAGLDRTQALHRYLEASALGFADRNAYVGDYTPRSVLDVLLSDAFAAERACEIKPDSVLVKPVAPGILEGSYTGCAGTAGAAGTDNGTSTTNLTVADKWGNVVEYTFTIEQIGGNGVVVPGRGFLLNNELTDFSLTPTLNDPNNPGPGKRPRSSMAPTIVLHDGEPFLALGSPGGATIITTVLQILINRIDFGMSLSEAIAAPRASQRNGARTTAEPAFANSPAGLALDALGHDYTLSAEIGAATAIEFLGDRLLLAAAEPVRRGSGSAGVVRQ